MSKKFREPDFSSGDLELRSEDGDVSIYGTAKGLEELAQACQRLVRSPGQGHIHLDKSDLTRPYLTCESKFGAIAIFDKN